MTIRLAGAGDAAALAELARTTFYDTFAATNNPADMALHLERAYGEPQQAAELADPSIVTLLVEEGGQVIAYAQLRDHAAPACISGPAPIELWRFYVRSGWHGRGVAHSLMDRVEDEARARGARTVWLGVWEHNPRARAFYAKCGFIEAGQHVFLFGTESQTDLVMSRGLAAD